MLNDDISSHSTRKGSRHHGSTACLTGEANENHLCQDDPLLHHFLHQPCHHTTHCQIHARHTNERRHGWHHHRILDLPYTLTLIGIACIHNVLIASHRTAHIGNGHDAPNDVALGHGIPHREPAFSTAATAIHYSGALVHRRHPQAHDHGPAIIGSNERNHHTILHGNCVHGNRAQKIQRQT